MLRTTGIQLGSPGKFNRITPLDAGASYTRGPVGRWLYPMQGHIGHMLKDIAGRLTIMSHEMRSTRLMMPVTRHQNLRVYRHIVPDFFFANWISPTASVVGNVVLSTGSSIFAHACIRNYHQQQQTIIGENTAVLERVTFMGQVRVGSECVIGIGSTLDTCEIGNNVFIGSRVHIALGCNIENGAIISSGSVVQKDTRVPAGELWAGNPAQKVGVVTPEQASEVQHQVYDYQHLAEMHKVAYEKHVAENSEFDPEWLRRVCAQIEERQSSIKLASATDIDVPLEARQFMTPRVSSRRPTEHRYIVYPVNKVAPWMPRSPDWAANV